MKSITYSSTINQKSYWWISIILLTLIISMISVDLTYGQNKSKNLRINGQPIEHIERSQDETRLSCSRQTNRTIDGTCNNIVGVETCSWGATDIGLFREMEAAYGNPDFYNEMGGNCRLSPRAISNIVVAQTEDILSPRNLSSLNFTWGQFLDHDISLTPEGHSEYVPILLPSDEPLFGAPIPFFRSEIYSGSGVNYDRQQTNLISSWIDGSQVYGSEASRSTWLRTLIGGKLKTSTGDMLPYNTIDGELDSTIDPDAPSMAGDGSGTAKVFVAGDVRANEQPGLTSLHTLFLREHNRLCDQFAGQGTDEEIYQRARKLVGATIQSITYNEFHPALGVDVSSYSGYDPNARPDITNLFATAAYRLGHTMVTDEIPLVGTNCQDVGNGSLALLEGFFNPSTTAEYGIEAILAGLASQTQQKVDAKVVDNLRNFLFPVPGSDETFGLDLASLNLQRGRDHGLPDYNSVRAHYTGFSANDFSEITSDFELQQALEKAYGSVYNIDVWVGLLCEDHLNGSSIGQTLNAMLGRQFEVLRDGDFYFYLNDPALSTQQRNQIQNTTLRDVIERNSPINTLQDNVFFAASCNPNNENNDPNGGGNNDGGGGDPNGGNNNGGGNNGGNNGGGNNGGGGNGGNGGGNGGGPGGGGPIIGGGNNGLRTIVLYPNPTAGDLTVSATFEEGSSEAIVTIQSLEGKMFTKEIVSIYDNSISHQMDISNLPTGMYFISIQSGEEVVTKKIVVE